MRKKRHSSSNHIYSPPPPPSTIPTFLTSSVLSFPSITYLSVEYFLPGAALPLSKLQVSAVVGVPLLTIFDGWGIPFRISVTAVGRIAFTTESFVQPEGFPRSPLSTIHAYRDHERSLSHFHSWHPSSWCSWRVDRASMSYFHFLSSVLTNLFPIFRMPAVWTSTSPHFIAYFSRRFCLSHKYLLASWGCECSFSHCGNWHPSG